MPLVDLPPDLERAVRLAAVPPHLAATLAELPQPLALDVELGEGELPLGARQWLKLALRGAGVRLASVSSGAALALRVSLGPRAKTLRAAELEGDLREAAPAVVLELLGPGHVAALLDQLAFASSSLATLRRVTSRMLETSDVELAYRLLLSGLTSGAGLGFHRAALFVPDGDRLVGAWAAGPADEAEAHRVWESLELEDVDVERTLDGAAAPEASPLTRRAREIRLDELDPWVSRALAARGARLLEPEDAGPLAALDVRTPFVVAALRARGAPLGLVFADDRFGGPIARERLRHLDVFVDQAALVVDNLRLFERTLGLSRMDPLTGVANRRELDARFGLLAERARATGAPLSLLLVDLDHFKHLNDTRGHEAGDAALREVAAVLAGSVRAEDTIARFGGDEFVVVLADLGAEALAGVARRVGEEAAARGLSLSVGGATCPGDVAAPEALFRAADEALYEAKQGGRRAARVGGRTLRFPATDRS